METIVPVGALCGSGASEREMTQMVDCLLQDVLDDGLVATGDVLMRKNLVLAIASVGVNTGGMCAQAHTKLALVALVVRVLPVIRNTSSTSRTFFNLLQPSRLD